MLQTSRLCLRNLQTDDAPVLFGYRNDPRCSRYQRYDDTSLPGLQSFVRTYSGSHFPSLKPEQHYAIVRREDRQLIGDVSIFCSEEDNCFTLGITIAPAFWRQGYAAEILSEIIAQLQGQYPAMELVALIERDNIPSLRLFQKLQFTEECYAPSIESYVYTIPGRSVMYEFHALDTTPIEQLVACFNAAFSDYEQPIHFTPESMTYYFAASSVDLSLSFGAFYEGQPVGLILNSAGIYHDQPVVFDAGTGIIPEHRGKKVFSSLFDHTCRQLRQRGIAKYYLEVLQANSHAIAIYQKKGFGIVRDYSVLVASGAQAQKAEVAVIPYPEFSPFPTAFFVEPSFEHTQHNLDKNPQLYEVVSLEGRAYCIYAKRQGAIVQMHYHTPEDLQEVLCALTCRFPSSMAKNIDFRYGDVLQMMERIGFREVTRQHEMALELSSKGEIV